MNLNEMKIKLINRGFIIGKQKEIPHNTVIGFETGDNKTFFLVYTLTDEFIYCNKDFTSVFKLILKLNRQELCQ